MPEGRTSALYLTVWNKGSAFDEARASPITWLVAIARNRAIDRARSGAFARRSEPIEAAADVADPGVSAFEFLASAQQQERLKSCFDEIVLGDQGCLHGRLHL